MLNKIEVFETRNNISKNVIYDLTKSGDLAKNLARHPHAWPGGYPKFAITDDGAALCPNCCKTEFSQILASTPGDGWHITALEINWEDGTLHCDHCSNRIESAYSEEN